jgi:hypothetical protein
MSKNDDSAPTDRDAALAGLTDEERAAIADDEFSEEERNRLQEIAGDDDSDDDDDDDGEDYDEGGGAASGDASGKPAAGASDDAGDGGDAGDDGAPSGEDDDDESYRPRYQVQLPEDFQQRVQALEEQEVELAKKFRSGEIEAEDFLAENKRIAKERRDLDKLETKHEIAEEFNAQTAEQEWVGTVNRFLRKVKAEEGIDYRSGDMSDDFDSLIKTLAANPKHQGKSYQFFLEQAHKATKALHGIGDKKPPKAQDDPHKKPAAAADPGKPAPKADGKPAARKPPVDQVPKTLANVPGGEGPGDVEDEFSHLDSLDGLEYETALASMSPAQRERYLKAA